MIQKRELENAIGTVESKPNCTFDDCQKLAVYYMLYNQLYGEQPAPAAVPVNEETVHISSGSEFARAVDGKQARRLWAIMDELLETLKVINGKLYDSVLRKIKES